MKEIHSIQSLKELSKEFQKIKDVVDPTSSLPNSYEEEECNWGDRFLKMIEDIEKKLKKSPDKSLKN